MKKAVFKKALLIWIFSVLHQDSFGANDGYKLLPSYDLCNPNMPGYYPPMAYLGHINDSTEVFINTSNANGISNIHCLMLFKTCQDCQIKVDPVGFFSYPSCLSRELSHIYDGKCTPGCIYVHLFDADYKPRTSLIMTKSVELNNYSTQSRRLHVVACGDKSNMTSVAMRIRLSVQSKDKVVFLHRYSPQFEFSSPYFPNAYTLNGESYTYKFESSEGYHTVTFNDWLISRNSFIRFYNANIVSEISGDHSRPYIVSTGNQTTMIFNTGPMRNTGMRLGFSAVVTHYITRESIPAVKFDCDRTVYSSGGVLSLGRSEADGNQRDCIWLIKKPIGYEMVQINILQFDFKSVGDEEIEIRDGITSKGLRRLYAIGSVLNGGSGLHSKYESPTGFYIRLKGRFVDPSSLVISYASYNYGCSPFSSSFSCSDKHCIADFLKCDGYDHCGDNSDETQRLCGPQSGGDTIRNHTATHAISIGVIIPIVVSVVLIVVLCLVFIFIRRCKRLENDTYGTRDPRRPPGSSNARGRRRRRGRNVQMSVTVSSGEHPPSYNEVIQNTPIGHFNMAFSWSGGDAGLPQPPSYQEAIGAISPDMSMSDLTQTGNSQCFNSAPLERNERAIDVAGLEPLVTNGTLNSLLDPSSYVSSSSSSEDLSHHRRDSVSSSDSSSENDHSFASNLYGNEPQLTNQHSSVKEEAKDGAVFVGENIKHKIKQDRGIEEGENEDEEDFNNYSSHRNRSFNEEEREEIESYNNKADHSSDRGTLNNYDQFDLHLRRDMTAMEPERNNENMTESRRIVPEYEAESEERVWPSEAVYHRDLDRKNKHGKMDNQRQRKNEVMGRSERGFYHGNDVRPKDIREGVEEAGWQQPWHRSPISPDNLRSQSLADLSLGRSLGLSAMPDHERHFPEVDKRFSYAGVGDTTFHGRKRDPYPTGSLVRDHPVENLHYFLPIDDDDERNRYRNSTSSVPHHKSSQKSKAERPTSEREGSWGRNAHSLQMLPENYALEGEEVPESFQTQDGGRNMSHKKRQRNNIEPHRHSQSSSSPPGATSRDYPRLSTDDFAHNSHKSPDVRGHQVVEHASSASLPQQRMPFDEYGGQLRNEPPMASSSSSSEHPPQLLAEPKRVPRPKPTPRKRVKSGWNNNSSSGGGGRPSDYSIPLTVTNYIRAPGDDDGMDVGDCGDQPSDYPLAQLVFKTTDDDIYV